MKNYGNWIENPNSFLPTAYKGTGLGFENDAINYYF
jgi:hypothetical protein